MSEMTLHEHEQNVERARAKLAGDLVILRSPSTFSAFKHDVKHEALDAKDALVKRAKSTAQSAVNELLGDLKAKAAANPAAALAIGAGIAWRLIHHPPIATSLIGVGLFSLWWTPAQRPQEEIESDYFVRGKERLKEQAGELASNARDAAVDVGQAIGAKTADLIDTAKDTMQNWGDGAREAEAGSPLGAGAEFIAAEANRTTRAVSDHARTAEASAFASDKSIHELTSDEEDVSDRNSRDRLLLAVAGVTVLAALGMAYKNRFADNVEID